eukprot:scaffold107541_cov20-Tisochrysis_lutea.AAC.1
MLVLLPFLLLVPVLVPVPVPPPVLAPVLVPLLLPVLALVQGTLRIESNAGFYFSESCGYTEVYFSGTPLLQLSCPCRQVQLCNPALSYPSSSASSSSSPSATPSSSSNPSYSANFSASSIHTGVLASYLSAIFSVMSLMFFMHPESLKIICTLCLVVAWAAVVVVVV